MRFLDVTPGAARSDSDFASSEWPVKAEAGLRIERALSGAV